MEKIFTREEKGFWKFVVYEYVHLVYMIPPANLVGGVQRWEPYQEGHRKDFALTMAFIRFLFKKYGDDFKCYYRYGDKLAQVYKSPEAIIAWLEKEYEAGNYRGIEWRVCFDLTKRLIPKKYLRYIRKLRVPKDQQTDINFDKERQKKHTERTIWDTASAWITWDFTEEEFAILRDKGVFYFLEYLLEPYCHAGIIRDHKKLRSTITALQVKDYQHEPALAKLIEKMIQMMKEAIKRGVGLYFVY